MQRPNKEHIQGKKENTCSNPKFEHSVRNLCFRKFEIPTPLFSLGHLFKKKIRGITSNKTQRTMNNTSHRFSKHAFGNTQSTPSTPPKGREPMVTHDTNSKNASGKSDEHSRETKEHLPLLQSAFSHLKKKVYITRVAPKTTLNASSKHFTKV